MNSFEEDLRVYFGSLITEHGYNVIISLYEKHTEKVK